MYNYLIYRTGSNSANQPCTFDAVPIAIVQAPNRDKACETTWGDEKPNVNSCPQLAAEIVAAADTSVWANQSLHAVPESRAKVRDWNQVLEQDVFRLEQEQYWAAEAAYYEQQEKERHAEFEEC